MFQCAKQAEMLSHWPCADFGHAEPSYCHLRICSGISIGSLNCILSEGLDWPVCNGNLTAISQQCTCPFITSNSNPLGHAQHSFGSSGSLLSQQNFLWLLDVLKTGYTTKTDLIWARRRQAGSVTVQLYSILNEMFQTMGRLLRKVFAVTRRILWRGLLFQATMLATVLFKAKERYIYLTDLMCVCVCVSLFTSKSHYAMTHTVHLCVSLCCHSHCNLYTTVLSLTL